MSECIYYLQANYYQRISQVINNEPLSYMKEHYSESPNWMLNKDNINIVDTLIWLTFSEKGKKEKLNDELDDYMNK